MSTRSGCVIPKPPKAEEKEFKSHIGKSFCSDHEYIVLSPPPADGLKDTKAADVMKVTYVPSLTTFEEEINELYP